MDKKEILEKFWSLMLEAKQSGKTEDIEVSMAMFSKAVNLLADASPKSAKELIDCYEGNLKFHNFVTETEAENIVSKFVNEDDTKGAKWKNAEEVFKKVEEMGGKIACVPHYNRYALFVAMNMYASDQLSTITKWVGDDKEKIFEACYDFAVTQLKDRDRENWIRPYFGLIK